MKKKKLFKNYYLALNKQKKCQPLLSTQFKLLGTLTP